MALFDRRDLAEAQKDLAQWLERGGTRYQKLCEWVEESMARPRGKRKVY